MEVQGSLAKVVAFPPSIDERCTRLVLGSMPGEASLEAQQYYAHPRNGFWPIAYRVLSEGKEVPPPSYEARLRFLLAHGIGLWDVLHACERQGSLDTAIRQPETNDFGELFLRYPKIDTIYCNGGKAYELFMKLVVPTLAADRSLRYVKLPSTSPAHTIPFERKADAWRVLQGSGRGS
jgi:double-stranded uracil-DNA glycosylase